MDALARLVAIEEIRQLKARYFRLMDTRDFDAGLLHRRGLRLHRGIQRSTRRRAPEGSPRAGHPQPGRNNKMDP
jgi:hypothetical protein